MKNSFLFVFTFLSIQLFYSQDIPQLKLTKDGVAPVFITIEEYNAPIIYDKALMWVNENYLNPKDAIKENIENTEIKVEGFKRRAWWYKSMGIKNYNHMFYTIEVVFNDDGFEFKYNVGDFFIDEGPSAQYDYRMFFKKDGTIRKQYTDAVTTLEFTMNDLLLSLYNSITGKSIQQEDKDLNKYLITLQESLSNDSTNPTTHFELACFYSLIEDENNAYQHLSEAVTFGFTNKERLQKEPDLKWLRHQSNYKEFVTNGYKFSSQEIQTSKSNTSYIDELKEIAKLKDEGILTEKEFNELKEKILNRVKNE